MALMIGRFSIKFGIYTVWDVLNTIRYEIFSSYIVYPVFSCLFGIMPDPIVIVIGIAGMIH